MQVGHGGEIITEEVRCALCCTCDIPAGCKVCGFLGHNARLGCFKCLKQFEGGVGPINFSGFDRSGVGTTKAPGGASPPENYAELDSGTGVATVLRYSVKVQRWLLYTNARS